MFDLCQTPVLCAYPRPRTRLSNCRRRFVRRIAQAIQLEEWDGQREQTLMKSAMACWIPVGRPMRDFASTGNALGRR